MPPLTQQEMREQLTGRLGTLRQQVSQIQDPAIRQAFSSYTNPFRRFGIAPLPQIRSEEFARQMAEPAPTIESLAPQMLQKSVQGLTTRAFRPTQGARVQSYYDFLAPYASEDVRNQLQAQIDRIYGRAQERWGKQAGARPVIGVAAQYQGARAGQTAPTRTAQTFEEILPEHVFIRPDILSQTAYGRIDPELEPQRWTARRALETQLAATGGIGFGAANVARQQLADQYSRMRDEQARAMYEQLYEDAFQKYLGLKEQWLTDPNMMQMPALPAVDAAQIPTTFQRAARWAPDLRLTYSPYTAYSRNITY